MCDTKILCFVSYRLSQSFPNLQKQILSNIPNAIGICHNLHSPKNPITSRFAGRQCLSADPVQQYIRCFAGGACANADGAMPCLPAAVSQHSRRLALMPGHAAQAAVCAEIGAESQEYTHRHGATYLSPRPTGGGDISSPL